MTQQEYQERRKKLLAKMADGSIAIIFSAPILFRNNDCEYPYRQNSDFSYLTGFYEPEAVLILVKNSVINNQCECMLFNRARDPAAEIWSGRRLGQDRVRDELGIEKVYRFDEFDQQLHLLLSQRAILYHALGQYVYADQILLTTLERLRRGSHAPSTLIDWRPLLHEIRLFKSPEEIVLIRRAGEISKKAHLRAMKKCRPGMFEYQLEGEIQHEFIQNGARFPAYNTIVGSGANGCILHYTENESKLSDGDLVLIDAGCEYQGYAADITRTFPINGKFSPEQRAIYNIVLASMNTALAWYKPGISIGEVNEQVTRAMITGLVELGILQGDVESLLENKAHRPFFMHGLSHWLGMDVHDVGDYGENKNRKLESGMVLTVEPGLYIAADASGVPEEYRGIGIRIEDNILITEGGNENLTAGVVKEVEDIERLMASAVDLYPMNSEL